MRMGRQLLAAATLILLIGSACGTENEAAKPAATPAPPSALVKFNAGAMEWSEGVTVDDDGNVYASITPQGRVVRIAAGSSSPQDFGKVNGIQQGDFGLLGLSHDAEGNIYGTVVSKNKAANGVWKFAAGTAATRIPGTENIPFANGVVADGSTLYISDTVGADGKGAVWRVKDGKAAVWARNDMFAGDKSFGFPVPIGPNGVDVHGGKVYLGLSEPAKIATIAINDDGSAGAVSVFADLTKKGPKGGKIGVDGIDVADDGTVYVGGVTLHTVYKVSSDGSTVTTVATAADGLDGPASVALRGDVLYVSNFSGALGNFSNKKGPGIIKVPV